MPSGGFGKGRLNYDEPDAEEGWVENTTFVGYKDSMVSNFLYVNIHSKLLQKLNNMKCYQLKGQTSLRFVITQVFFSPHFSP